MAELLRLDNFGPLNVVETTQLDADADAGQAVVTVKNSQGFATGDFFRIGDGEQAEIKKVLSISGNNITADTNFSFKHLKYEKLIKLFGDQIRIFRASNIDGSIPADESFTELATISIEADQLFTDYLDATGGSDFWYKFVYRNSDNLNTTDLADSIAVRGGDFGHYVSVSEIRNEAGFTNNPDITDQMIADRREDAESEVKGALSVAGYNLPLTNPIPAVIKNATKLLAAGYLLLQDYGVTAEGSNKEGQA